MSYSALRLLTLIGFISLFATAPLSAQRKVVASQLDRLASPIAFERAEAIASLASVDADIDADLRVAFKATGPIERAGLLKVALLRDSDALIQYGAEGLSSADERVTHASRDYLLARPVESLSPDKSSFSSAQRESWDEFYRFRLRRDIGRALIDAYLMPGEFFGQFDALRRLNAERLDAQLLALAGADPVFADALDHAARERIEDGASAALSFSAPWRSLKRAAGAFTPAAMYLNKGSIDQEVEKARKARGETGFRAALEVLSGVRAAGIRALAHSNRTEDLLIALPMHYRVMLEFHPEATYAPLIDIDSLRVEVEVTLARLGDDTLLHARISRMRKQLDVPAHPDANIQLSPATRPDLMTRNAIAHLLLRGGDAHSAELEWRSAIESAEMLRRGASDRNRSSLSSYLATVYYNLGCAQGLQLKLSKSLTSLKKAVSYGYKNFDWMLKDGDLTHVRRTEDFKHWFESVAPPSVVDAMRRADAGHATGGPDR